MPQDPIAALAAKSAALKAEYAQLDPDLIRKAINELISSEDVSKVVDQVLPLFEALPDTDPLKPHISGWLQIQKSVLILLKQTRG